jgi:hypothetical protein
MMEFVNGKDDIPYMKWKIKFMFETTNQKITNKNQGIGPMFNYTILHPFFASPYAKYSWILTT